MDLGQSPDNVDRESGAAVSALLSMYEAMLLIRMVEESLDEAFSRGIVPGFIHLSIGQEATAVGVNHALEPGDTIASTHRGHGHALAKGIQPLRLIQEILGKDEGICRGRGGSLHVADISVGMLGANGIVGGGIPIALGSALAHMKLGTRNVAAVFFGDGALSEGVCYEAMNLASLWRLPLLFVCENNGWSEFSAFRDQYAGDLRKLAGAFSLPFMSVDGNDVEAVFGAASAVVARMRDGGGPSVLECRTMRIGGHYQGDTQRYRDRSLETGTSDPLERAAKRLAALGAAPGAMAAVEARIRQQVAEAMAAAQGGNEADFAAAFADVYSGGVPSWP